MCSDETRLLGGSIYCPSGRESGVECARACADHEHLGRMLGRKLPLPNLSLFSPPNPPYSNILIFDGGIYSLRNLCNLGMHEISPLIHTYHLLRTRHFRLQLSAAPKSETALKVSSRVHATR